MGLLATVAAVIEASSCVHEIVTEAISEPAFPQVRAIGSKTLACRAIIIPSGYFPEAAISAIVPSNQISL